MDTIVINETDPANRTIALYLVNDAGVGINPALIAGDVKITKFGGSATNTVSLPTAIGTGVAGKHTLLLDATEVNVLGPTFIEVVKAGVKSYADAFRIVPAIVFPSIPSTAQIATAVLDALLTDHAVVGSVADGIAIAAGLLQGNFYIDNTNNGDPNGMTAARMRLFRDGAATSAATAGGSGEGEFAIFTVATTYVGVQQVATHRVVRTL